MAPIAPPALTATPAPADELVAAAPVLVALELVEPALSVSVRVEVDRSVAENEVALREMLTVPVLTPVTMTTVLVRLTVAELVRVVVEVEAAVDAELVMAVEETPPVSENWPV